MRRAISLFTAIFVLPIVPSGECATPFDMLSATPSHARDATSEQKEAFNAAKDLGTIEAWEAFLNAYSKGFYADLARAYVRKLDAANAPAKTRSNSTKTKPAKATQLETVSAGPGSAPWRMRSYDMDEGTARTVAASVTADGVELLFHCTSKSRLAGILREAKRGAYPKFDARIRQGLAAKGAGSDNGQPALIPMSFSDGTVYSVSASVQEINGEVRLTQDGEGAGFRAAGQLVSDLMTGETVGINVPPFSATFQLKRSRKALCSVINKCGAKVARCKKFVKRKKTYKKKRRKRKVNRANSPYHDNKGKLMEGYIYDKNGNVTQDNGGGE